MASGHTAQQLIDAALLLPLADRERIVEVLQDSIDRQNFEEPADEVEAAWSDEIARRIADIDSGRVKTVPSEEAEMIIRRATNL
jgi:putative addiction module component (TIGR02574 family)